MNRRRHQNTTGKSRGFTILELMVATLVFAVVLLLVTAGIMQIARVYYKGVTESNVQNTARNIIDTIAQSIQFSGGEITPTASSPAPNQNYAFCVGSQQFSYRLGWQVEDVDENLPKHQLRHALVQRSAADCTPQNLALASVEGRDLMGEHMRLSNLVVEPVSGQTNQYKVLVRVVYGDDDLLNNPTGTDASCKPERAGTQFCAVSQLSTIVVKRVE